MMAADGWYIYTGREAVPDYVTRVRIHESVTVIPARAFRGHRHIEELECHDRVKNVEENAFDFCLSLRRVIMPDVTEVGQYAFVHCKALTDVECDKLEIIGGSAFDGCRSLGRINLPSAKIVQIGAFISCKALTKIKFGKELEKIERLAFSGCTSLERITIPLKDGMITSDDIFQWCENLEQVDLVEGELLRDTIATLLLEEWRIDMNDEFDTIKQILPNTSAGDDSDDVGGKALAIRTWTRLVLGKIIRYKAQHHSLLNEAATTLQQHALPQDIVMNNVLPFVELPSYTFEGEDRKRKRKKQQNDNARQDDNVANLSGMLKEGLLENEEQNDAIMMLSAENQQLTDALATMIVDSVRYNSELRIRVSELERENARFVEQRDELEQEVARLVEAGEELTEENGHLGDEVAILEEENGIIHEANEGLVEENEEHLERRREIESSRVYQFVSSVCGAATRLTDLFRKRVNSNENNECDRPTKRVRLSDAC